MPRLNNGTELWRKLDELAVYRIVSAGGSQAFTASATAGATTVTLGSSTLFTLNDPVIISGPGGVELNVIGTPATAMPLIYKLGAAQDTSQGTVTMYEAVKTVLGHLTEDGAALNGTFTQNEVRSAIADLPIAYFGAQAGISFTFNLLGFNVLNFQTAFGITESEQGAGTQADPYQAYFGGSSFGTQTTQCFRFTGSRHDGSAVHVELYDGRIEIGGSTSLNRTAPASIPCTVKGTAFRVRHGATLLSY
jgi:hypothetical protein